MKRSHWITLIIVLLIGLFIRSRILPADESAAQERRRLAVEAEGDFHTALTNDIVGLHRVIRAQTSLYDQDIKAWRAEATVEYVNVVGGIQRTNVHYAFGKSTHYDGRSYSYCYRVPAH